MYVKYISVMIAVDIKQSFILRRLNCLESDET